MDTKGYVSEASLNLLPDVGLADFEQDLSQGSGQELAGKFRAAHSSSALAVNVFAPFKRAMADLWLDDLDGFTTLHFERKCPHGLPRAMPPNLDVVVQGPSAVIGIESKCTEFLTPKAAEFSPRYESDILDERRLSGWFRHMMALRTVPGTYLTLDAAQLIKHAFGLAHTFRGQPVTLLYLFWEPANPDCHMIFALHRREIAAFAKSVAGTGPTFRAMSYPELWNAWERRSPPDWLSTHINNLRRRYSVAMTAGL